MIRGADALNILAAHQSSWRGLLCTQELYLQFRDVQRWENGDAVVRNRQPLQS